MLGDLLHLIWGNNYQIGCHFVACQYGPTNLNKVYVCLFNQGLIQGHSVYKTTPLTEPNIISQFETANFQDVLLVPKGQMTTSEWTTGSLNFEQEKKYVTPPKK